MYINSLLIFVKHSFKDTKEKHPNIDDKILKSALVYQYLHFFYFERDISINKILEINNGEIGLMGPGNGFITWLFERTFGWIDILNSHIILHDAFGRFYNHHELGRGYTYAIPEKYTTKLIKRSPLFGQISGLLYCMCRRLTI